MPARRCVRGIGARLVPRKISLANNFLYGIRFRAWARLLRDNRYAVDARYWHRALAVTGASLVNSAAHRLERAFYADRVDAAPPGPPPLFILGHWRTGTTHLHYLLARDPALACPSTFQVVNPWTFLLTEKALSPWVDRALPKTRPMDAMALSSGTPSEDEFALALMTGLSPYSGLSFPRRREAYARYLDFAGAGPGERAAWKAAFRLFFRKLSLRHPGRRLIFKSPAHTARIPLLLESFPDARFAHIVRDPYAVFQSSRHIISTLFPYMYLQEVDAREADEDILRRYEALNGAYLRDRALIPWGRLHELRYEDLARDPLGSLERLYADLGLPGWAEARPAVEGYVAALRGYRPNAFPGLDPAARAAVAERWGRFFTAFGYRP